MDHVETARLALSMRILMPSISLPPHMNGGGPMTARNNAKALTAMGHDVRIYFPAHETGHDNWDGYEVHRIASPNLYWDYRKPQPKWKKLAWHALENHNPWAAAAARRQIEDFKPDLVFTCSIENVNVVTWQAAQRAGVKSIHQAFSTYLLCWKSSMMRADGAMCAGQCGSCRNTSIGKRFHSQYPQGLVGDSNFIFISHI